MFTTRILLRFHPAAPHIQHTARSFATTSSRRASPLETRSTFHQGGPSFTQLHSSPRRRVDWKRAWHQSQQSRGRQAFNYQRFNATSNLFKRWAARPTFYYEIGGGALVVGGIYTYNLETVDVSGRRRFNICSREYEEKMGQQSFKEILQEFQGKIMSPRSKESVRVQRVLERLLPHSGLQDANWEVFVINDDTKNAFVIPGGKVFVFRGMLDICQSDDSLAAVLGHEIAHNVAHHMGEKMSKSFVLLAITIVGSQLLGVDFGMGRLASQLAFELPGSRAQEQEADYIGLLMMAESCYDPHAAMQLWATMENEAEQAPPQFLSTHPSNHNRLDKIRSWLPEAELKRENGDCHSLRPYMNDFSKMTDTSRW